MIDRLDAPIGRNHELTSKTKLRSCDHEKGRRMLGGHRLNREGVYNVRVPVIDFGARPLIP